jgi:PAS domain S-box-containing protein
LEDQLEHSGEEIKRLQRCINDLVSVLALPAIWTGGEPSQIVSTLLDALLNMLSLDIVYARLNAPTDEAPIEVVRMAQYQKLPDRPQEIGEFLNRCLGWDPGKWPPLIRTCVGDGDISLVPLRLGLHGEVGLIVAGSERADFPQQTERLLLDVAANQASIGLQEARLLAEQKRVADELDRRVAQRTRELGAANEDLRESELHLRRMTETIPEMLWSATPEGAIDYCNARVLDYSGFSAEEIMGNSWSKLLHPDDVDQALRVWMSCVAAGTPYRVEVRIFHAADCTYRWCVKSALPLLDQQGRILKWYGTVVDMHDWKRAQEDLRNTQAELGHLTRVMTIGALTASIAHEINQPLAGIITNASTCLRMLASEPPNVEGARETARRTIRDGNRASEVVTRLRALFSKKPSTTECMDLNEAAKEVIALSSSELQKSRVILRLELADDLPPVKGDRVQLQQVIMNLLRNASDAMRGVDDRPRQLVIKTKLDEPDRVCLTVQDTGLGFDPQAMERIFEPFYTTKNDGMGIGLSVSRSIIEGHQGRLWAALNDGPGATFSFSIPRLKPVPKCNGRLP